MKITNLLNSNLVGINDLAIDVLVGLDCHPKKISSKYFYDDLGSELFQKITQQKEYYLTDKEFEIFSSFSKPPIKIENKKIDIIELGVGDGHKSKLLLDGYLREGYEVNYFPVDISAKALELLEKNITVDDNITVEGIVGDYIDGLAYARRKTENQQLVLFLGSNIGNFDSVMAKNFLKKIWTLLQKGDSVLLGFDLKKEIEILLNAYNDSNGTTSQFNLNVLRRINSELNANFVLDNFFHYGTYNAEHGAMESFLISKVEQEVSIKDLNFKVEFDAFEPIHLEYSFKYSKKDIADLCKSTGYKLGENFYDQSEYFCDSLWIK